VPEASIRSNAESQQKTIPGTINHKLDPLREISRIAHGFPCAKYGQTKSSTKVCY